MKTTIRLIVLGICVIAMPFITAQAQEVVVKGFPLGVGGSVDSKFFEPYYPPLQMIADTLQRYPLVQAVITGGADGTPYRYGNDAMNSGLALGRAHALFNVLVDQFKIDSSQLIIRSGDAKARGGEYRYVSVRIAWELAGLGARVERLENRPPVETRVTEVKEVTNSIVENMGIQVGGGVSSSPFGGVPFLSGAVTWKRMIFLEGIAGQTLWDNKFRIDGEKWDTRRRLAAIQAVVFPFENKRVGFVGGWLRAEEISDHSYKYVKMSEGPVLGVRVEPWRFLSVTGAYNPSRQRVAGRADADNSQLMLMLTAHTFFGAGKTTE